MFIRPLLMSALLLFAARAAAQSPQLPGFRASRQFAELERWSTLECGVRTFVSAPATFAGSSRTLVVYATPNGNTIEQTLGCARVDGLDWHFDIQHVAAQIRRMREIQPTAADAVVLAVVQAPKLSWPSFRQTQKGADALIQQIVESMAKEVGAERVVLSGHSGGGSLIFGYLDSVDVIPAAIDRIVFLDANYAYADEKQHGDKLLAWLRSAASRRLVAIAYDDREIVLDGKKVVGPTGGTFRASQRMIDRFARELALTDDRHGPFLRRSGLGGQIELFIHPNPGNKILHTALVGEMNGLLHGLTLGTDLESKWGAFGGPRAYTRWIQDEPAVDPTPPAQPRPLSAKSSNERLRLPPRPKDASPGSAFLKAIEPLSPAERETAIRQEITRGNVPDFLRALKAMDVSAADGQGKPHAATCFVMPDYLAVGNDEDFFRLPMTPQAAQAIADACEASLITVKISNDIFQHADLRLAPKPLTKDRETAATFYQHHQIIEEQRKGQPLNLLVAGIKKDVVLTNRLKEKPHRVAIYGWHYPDGKPIQSLYVGHVDWYVDYSHGIRLMSRTVIVDGRETTVDAVLKDSTLCGLLSSEGVIDVGYK